MSANLTNSPATTDGSHTLPLAEHRKGSDELEDLPAKEDQVPEITFPEGGWRAWSVAVGCALVLFSTFGLVNAYG